jgi:hypothetical protein
VIALTIFGMIGLATFGILVLGARSAGSGERITEQARRYRMANDIIARQISATEPIKLPKPAEKGSLEDEEEEDTSAPYFYGGIDAIDFVTTAPQRPDASGMAIVNYWVEDGKLMMSERPVFSAYAGGKKLDSKDKETDDTLSTVLLYDVESVTFSYQRESDSDQWLDEWDATSDDQLPACVRIDVRPAAVGGPDFYHEIPVMVGSMNQIVEVDEDFYRRKGSKDAGDTGDGTTPKSAKPKTPKPAAQDNTPNATVPDGNGNDNDDDTD